MMCCLFHVKPCSNMLPDLIRSFKISINLQVFQFFFCLGLLSSLVFFLWFAIRRRPWNNKRAHYAVYGFINTYIELTISHLSTFVFALFPFAFVYLCAFPFASFRRTWVCSVLILSSIDSMVIKCVWCFSSFLLLVCLLHITHLPHNEDEATKWTKKRLKHTFLYTYTAIGTATQTQTNTTYWIELMVKTNPYQFICNNIYSHSHVVTVDRRSYGRPPHSQYNIFCVLFVRIVWMLLL